MDALAQKDDEGRGNLRYASGSWKQALIRGFPNGETRRELYRGTCESIHSSQEVTWGTETSKYPEEKKENSIPQVVASESGQA